MNIACEPAPTTDWYSSNRFFLKLGGVAIFCTFFPFFPLNLASKCVTRFPLKLVILVGYNNRVSLSLFLSYNNTKHSAIVGALLSPIILDFSLSLSFPLFVALLFFFSCRSIHIFFIFYVSSATPVSIMSKYVREHT